MSSFTHQFRFNLFLLWQFTSTKIVLLLSLIFLIVPFFYLETLIPGLLGELISSAHLGDRSIDGADVARLEGMMIYMIHGSLNILFWVLAIWVVLSSSEVTLVGQPLQTLLSRNKSRLTHYLATLSGLAVLMFIISTSYYTIPIILSASLEVRLFIVISGFFYFLSMVLLFMTILNFESTAKQSVAFFIAFFFVLPGIITVIPLSDSNSSVFITILDKAIRAIEYVLSPHFALSRLIDNAAIKQYVDYAALFKSLILVAIYLGLNLYQFKRKDIG
jgi:hypothetical protein